MKVKIINNYNLSFTDYFILEELFSKINSAKTFAIILTNDENIKLLNNNYRNINKETDVLSFPTNNEIIDDLGDIFISIDKCKKQAIEYQNSFKAELAFLAVHGYLHLLGYDHINKEDEKIMLDKQEEILKLVNLERK